MRIKIELEKKTAKKLLEALSNRTFEGLTKAQANALSDFVCDLQYEIDMCDAYKQRNY